MGERKRGRAGQAARLRRLALYPLCVECFKRGLVKATAIIDHITPLALGGRDTDENCQGLCLMCNAIKTAAESASAGGVANHPEWLKPSALPLTILCGPPCSGKSTYVAEHAEARDTVIDLDTILQRLDPAYRHWSGALDPALFNRAIRVRNAMLGALAQGGPGRAFFIVSAPTHGERAWWYQHLGGQLMLLEAPMDVLKARAMARGTPRARAGVDAWYAAARERWTPPRLKLAKVGIGADGYPVGGEA